MCIRDREVWCQRGEKRATRTVCLSGRLHAADVLTPRSRYNVCWHATAVNSAQYREATQLRYVIGRLQFDSPVLPSYLVSTKREREFICKVLAARKGNKQWGSSTECSNEVVKAYRSRQWGAYQPPLSTVTIMSFARRRRLHLLGNCPYENCKF